MKQTIIYLRTSTEEQNPENQLKDCEALAHRLNLIDYDVLQEKKSAFKDTAKRKVFDLIKKAIQEGDVKNLIVWDYDRLFRNRIKTIDFIRNYSGLGLKVYSFRQAWFEDIKKIPEPFNDMMNDLMLQLIGWIAEEESRKKSERVKNTVVKEQGITKSYKGNKWGRKSIQTDRLRKEVLQLKEQGLSIRNIAKQVYYYDKNNNKKNPSIAFVHKLLSNSN